MDQVEVDVVEPELLEALDAGATRPLMPLVDVEALRRHEDLVAIELRSAQCLSDGGLVAVGGRGVDVAIAGRERERHGLDRLVRRDLEDAEAELGDLDA